MAVHGPCREPRVENALGGRRQAPDLPCPDTPHRDQRRGGCVTLLVATERLLHEGVLEPQQVDAAPCAVLQSPLVADQDGGPIMALHETEPQLGEGRTGPVAVMLEVVDDDVGVVVAAGLPTCERVDAPSPRQDAGDPASVEGIEDLDEARRRHFALEARAEGRERPQR